MAPLLRAAVLLGVCASASCYPLRPCSEEKLFTEDGQLNHAKPRDETFANSIRAYVIGDFGVDSKENAGIRYRSDFDVERRNKVGQWMEWYSSPAATVSKSHLGQRKAAADFVINVGDSFYTDVINTTDSRWNTTFEHTFAEPQDAYWYSVLGNHDWYGNRVNLDDSGTTAQVNYTQENPYNKWCMPDFNYTMTATVTGDQPFTAQFVFIDTMSLLLDSAGGCRNASDDHTVSRERTECRGPLVPSFADQYNWIEETLCSSTADWKIVVGHYPLVSAGSRLRGSDMTVTDEWVEELYTKGLITESVRTRFSKHTYTPSYVNATMDATLTEMLSRCGTDAYLGGHEHMTQLLTHTHRETGHNMTLFSYGDSGKANLANMLTVDPDATTCRITGQCFGDDAAVKAAWGDEWSLNFKDINRGAFGDLEIFYDRMVLDTVSADGLRLDQFQQKKCRTNCVAEAPTTAPHTATPAPVADRDSCDDGLSSAEIAAVAVCAVLGVAIFAAAAFFAGRAAGAKPSNEPM